MDEYKDLISSGSRLSEFVKSLAIMDDAEIDYEYEEDDEEEENLLPADYNKMFAVERDSIIERLTGTNSQIQTEAILRVVFFAKSKDQSVIQNLFSCDIIKTLGDIFCPLLKSEILSVCFYIAQSSEEVLLNFMETELFRILVQGIYESKEEDLKVLVTIFKNIIRMSPLTACVFYGTGFMFDSANGLKDHEINNEYTLWFIATVVDEFVNCRITKKESAKLGQRVASLKDEYPCIQIDPWYTASYVENTLSLANYSPLYNILKEIIRLDLNPETTQAVLHTFCNLVSEESDDEFNCGENCNTILNDIGFVARVEDFMETNDLGIRIQVMWIIAHVLTHTKIISSVCQDIFCRAISSGFTTYNNPESQALNEITLIVVGNIAALTERNSEIFDSDNIRFIKMLAKSSSFNIRSLASYSILMIEKARREYEELTMEFMSNLTDLLNGQDDKKKVRWLKTLFQLIEMKKGSTKCEDFINCVRDSNLYDGVQEMLDDENEKISDAAQNFLDICNENNMNDIIERENAEARIIIEEEEEEEEGPDF